MAILTSSTCHLIYMLQATNDGANMELSLNLPTVPGHRGKRLFLFYVTQVYGKIMAKLNACAIRTSSQLTLPLVFSLKFVNCSKNTRGILVMHVVVSVTDTEYRQNTLCLQLGLVNSAHLSWQRALSLSHWLTPL